METLVFSKLDYATGLEFLDLSKRYAKKAMSLSAEGQKLSWHQDQVAHKLGYQNWSILHSNLANMSWSGLSDIRSMASRSPHLYAFLQKATERTIIVDEAVATMKDWARSNYTPLVDFAYHDSESENGYAWPSVDMDEELAEEFAGQFPDDLIQQVGYALDAEEGPWGVENYGDD